MRSDKIAPRTYNMRIYILISFFKYAIQQGWRDTNPLENVEIREPLDVDVTKPLDIEEVKAALKKVQRNTLSGKRNYALLCILLTMGLHVSEIVSLRYDDILITDGKVTITYQQKGGSKETQSLRPVTARVFMEYLTSLPDVEHKVGDPVWFSFARNSTRGKPLTQPAIADICKKYLDTSRVESVRLTYLKMKNEVGIIGLEKLLEIDK